MTIGQANGNTGSGHVPLMGSPRATQFYLATRNCLRNNALDVLLASSHGTLSRGIAYTSGKGIRLHRVTCLPAPQSMWYGLVSTGNHLSEEHMNPPATIEAPLAVKVQEERAIRAEQPKLVRPAPPVNRLKGAPTAEELEDYRAMMSMSAKVSRQIMRDIRGIR